jgi:prepilin-type N-terminal cleavage/methylation domain-containing protein
MLKTKLKNNIETERGFTMVETLVAIFILLISITGPMVFSQNGLRAAFQSRDQITAFYLAQDVIEFVKNRRDHNILEPGAVGGSWLDGLEDCMVSDPNNYNPDTEYGCTINTTDTDSDYVSDVEACLSPGGEPGCLGVAEDGSEDNKLRINTDGFFTNDGSAGETSIFARNIYIREVVPNQEAEVVVKIRWTSQDTIGVRDITVVEYIYNWAGQLGL